MVPLERAPREDDDELAEYAAMPGLGQARHIGRSGTPSSHERRMAHHVHVSPECRGALFPPRPRPQPQQQQAEAGPRGGGQR